MNADAFDLEALLAAGETLEHALRVAELAVRLACRLGMGGEALAGVRAGAVLHDVGKLVVPDRILLKPGPLTEEEWHIVRQHPVWGARLLAAAGLDGHALAIVVCHHERWDGSGYPRGLRRDEIPPAARLFAVVDVYDALTHDRPYRPAWPEEEALAYIRERADVLFDPQVVAVFINMLKEEHRGG